MTDKVVSVVGQADEYDLVFIKGSDGKWAVSIPPDMSDGKYVVGIYATDTFGNIGYWTGILYVTNGRMTCLHLLDDAYAIILLSERKKEELLDDKISCLLRRCF